MYAVGVSREQVSRLVHDRGLRDAVDPGSRYERAAVMKRVTSSFV